MSQPDSSEKGENFSPSGKIVSPFAHAETAVPPVRRSGSTWAVWLLLGLILLAAGAAGGYFALGYLRNPYRTLEPFPVDKYLANYKALSGSKFKADLRVEADLGWNNEVGKLMLFSTPTDPHPIVVMIPSRLATIYFTKGQTYLAELQVGEGGLIYANSFEKN